MNKAHKNLKLWMESFEFVKVIYTSTMTFPQEEKFGLTSQLRRAVVSIPVNIAEGAARRSKKEFLNFLSIARGSLAELDTLISVSRELNFIEAKECNFLMKQLDQISILLSGLIRKVERDIKGVIKKV